MKIVNHQIIEDGQDSSAQINLLKSSIVELGKIIVSLKALKDRIKRVQKKTGNPPVGVAEIDKAIIKLKNEISLANMDMRDIKNKVQ